MHAEQREQQLCLSLTGQTAHAQHLAAVQLQVYSV